MLTQKEKDYLKKLPSSKKVIVKQFNPEAKKVGISIVKTITKNFHGLQVLFMGSTALGIAGQNDIDIYVVSEPKEFEKYLPSFEMLFGKPKYRHETFIEWNFKTNDYKVELYLTELPKRHYEIYKILSTNKILLKEYEEMKLAFNGKSFRDYQKAKYEFFNRISKL